MILGVIADDHTGATDVASMLVRSGLRTVQIIGVPTDTTDAGEVDAVVIALKSRTIAPAEAIEQSLAALRWLQQRGVQRFYFKYCSTFDSTPKGNIGPVADALMQALGTQYSIACPAFPENQRTIFKGHLFVGDLLLSDSGMRNHPLTPMTDANLVRVLQAQSRCNVGLLSHLQIAKGAASLKQVVEQKIAEAAKAAPGVPGVIDIADAITNDDLMVLGHALADVPLVTAGSGLALGLAAAYIERGLVKADAHAAQLPVASGKAVVISGSCSVATNAQVKHWIASGKPAIKIDAREIAGGHPVAQRVLDWHAQQAETCLIYATSPPDEVAALQKEFGANALGEQIEHGFAQIAQGLIAQQVRRFVVAGGETSGAVVNALGVQSLKIGETIDPGVPWTSGQVGKPLLETPAPVLLALKSGNFGTEDFFAKALAMRDAR